MYNKRFVHLLQMCRDGPWKNMRDKTTEDRSTPIERVNFVYFHRVGGVCRGSFCLGEQVKALLSNKWDGIIHYLSCFLSVLCNVEIQADKV